MKRTDILLDVDLDLAIDGGDFVTGLSDDQNVALLAISEPGHWKQWPLLGAAVAQYIGARLNARTAAALSLALAQDGYKLNTSKMATGGQFNISYANNYTA